MRNLRLSGVLVCLAALAPAGTAQTTSGYTIATAAGTGTRGYAGDGGPAIEAQLAGPTALAIGSGKIYIADQFNHLIRLVSADGAISTVAGNGSGGYAGDGSAATSAQLFNPVGVAVDASGNVYIAQSTSAVVRKVNSSGTISTVAGTATAGFSGDGGAATSAQLSAPSGVAVDAAGNLYIADSGNHRIRKVTTAGTITTVAGNGAAGYVDDGGPAVDTSLNSPRHVTVDASGNLYIADSGNHRVRKVTPDGIISTVAGNGAGGFAGDGGDAVRAQLNRPFAVAVDADGNIYIADYYNSRIRKVTSAGVIGTIAGNGRFVYSGDGGVGTRASLNFPTGVAVDAAGKVYIADNQNNVVRTLVIPPPSIAEGGVAGPADFGASADVGQGSWIEIRGANLAVTTRQWNDDDFKDNMAPTSLDGTSVTIGGHAAFIGYVSPGQINALVPSGVDLGTQELTVTTAAGTSQPYQVNVTATQPALRAPANFNVAGLQYAAATFADGVTYALPPGVIKGIDSRPAKPGETIILTGVGFGPVTPDIPTGQKVQQSTAITLPLQVFVGQTPATVNYAGLAPNAVGMYQISIVAPDITGDALPLTFTLNGVPSPQSLFIAVQK